MKNTGEKNREQRRERKEETEGRRRTIEVRDRFVFRLKVYSPNGLSDQDWAT